MSRIIIEAGSQIALGGHTFGYLGQNADGIWLSRSDKSGAKEVIGVEALISMIKSESATIAQPQQTLNTAVGNVSNLQSRLHAVRRTMAKNACPMGLRAGPELCPRKVGPKDVGSSSARACEMHP